MAEGDTGRGGEKTAVVSAWLRLGLRWFGHPMVWLLVLGVALGRRIAGAGLLVPRRVPDTSGYLALAQLSLDTPQWWEKLLGTTRTYGYPLFLKLTGWVAPDLTAVPGAHLLCYIFAIVVFWWGFSRYSGRPWLAFWAAMPLFYAELLSMVNRVQADALASASAVAGLGLLLGLARRPRSAALWLAVVAVVTYTYHVRPAYLFLLPLFPLLALALRRLLPGEGRWRWRWGMGLAVALVLPFLAFCSLRWVVMGHFGLVSFGGYNLAGLTTPLLDDELVAELPEGDRELAAAVLELRRKKGLETVGWDTPMEEWYRQYNASVWRVAVPAARQEARQEARRQTPDEAQRLDPRERERRRRELKALWKGRTLTPEERAEERAELRAKWRGQRQAQRQAQRQEARRLERVRQVAEMNRALSHLARSILVQRPALYGKWLVGGVAEGLEKVWEIVWVRRSALALLVLAALAGGLRWLFRPWLRWSWRSSAVALVAVGYFAAGFALVVLVEVPIDRYMNALLPLLPSALVAALAEPVLGLLQKLRAAAGMGS
ncbi:MAG: hypothetical protein SX243_06225 [Acidobacteriota bacterium]|nr:hypothetical protein [Acidobacteriota bacterium]